MMDAHIRKHFRDLINEENLEDPSWILTLDNFDEPPLFCRTNQVEFLRSIPEELRPVVALDVALSLIEQIADVAAQRAPDRRFYICVTISDFNLWYTGEQTAPTPAIYVDPNEGNITPAEFRLVSPHSTEGLETARWLEQLGEQYVKRYCIGELSAGTFDPQLHRIYVGWRCVRAPNVRSVGSDLSSVGS